MFHTEYLYRCKQSSVQIPFCTVHRQRRKDDSITTKLQIPIVPLVVLGKLFPACVCCRPVRPGGLLRSLLLGCQHGFGLRFRLALCCCSLLLRFPGCCLRFGSRLFFSGGSLLLRLLCLRLLLGLSSFRQFGRGCCRSSTGLLRVGCGWWCLGRRNPSSGSSRGRGLRR